MNKWRNCSIIYKWYRKSNQRNKTTTFIQKYFGTGNKSENIGSNSTLKLIGIQTKNRNIWINTELTLKDIGNNTWKVVFCDCFFFFLFFFWKLLVFVSFSFFFFILHIFVFFLPSLIHFCHDFQFILHNS